MPRQQTKKTGIQPHQAALLASVALTIVLWLIPTLQFFFLPFQYLNTHLHEMGHALAAVITGGSVSSIQVFSDGSGVTQATMNYPVIVASAGYVGSSLFGAAMIMASRTPRGARIALIGVAILLSVECLLWLRGSATGEISGFAYMAAFWLMGLLVRGWFGVFVAQFFGLQQCLSSLHAVIQLVNPRVLSFADNDASILAGITHIPAILWSIGWSVLSLLLVVGAFSFAWSAPKTRVRST